MNAFTIVIMAALIGDYLLGLVANVLNLRALRTDIPGPLKGLYNAEDYERSQDYTRAATRLGFVSGTATLALVLAFWFAGGFNVVDELARGWGLPTIVTGLLYIGVLLGAYAVLTLPFAVYNTFVIEQRFGFNRTTPGLFVVDRLKAVGLALVLGGPLLAGIISLFEYGGPVAWLYAWLAVMAFSLAVQYVAPTWILPLFSKFTPMPEGELRSAILEYARSSDFPVSNVFVVDSSRRSTRANAFFTGLGRHKRIALFDTLLQQHTTPETVAVLAHEIGHYKKKHVVQRTAVSLVHTGIIFFVLSFFLNSPGLYEAFYMGRPSVYAGLLFFGLLYTPVELLISIAMNALSRRNEREADRFAVATTGDAPTFAVALKKLATNNLTNLTPHPIYVFLYYSHPPLLERVQAMTASRGNSIG